MATIGTFASTGNGFSGAIKTLNLNVKAKLIRVDKSASATKRSQLRSGHKPARVELGAAGRGPPSERDYLSVKLDDPSFPAPIYATLIEVEGAEADGLAGAKVSFLEAVIATVVPVDGLRPSRAGLSLTLNWPNREGSSRLRSRPHPRLP
jgi:uncharacterized protein (DUF736 family)